MRKLLATALILILTLSQATLAFAAESYVQLPPDSTGKMSRTTDQVVNSNDVYSSVVNVGSALNSNLADVGNTSPGSTGLNILQTGVSTGSYELPPDQGYTNGQVVPAKYDADGLQMVRAWVSTNEGNLYDTFPGTSLNAAWTSSIGTGGSIAVSGGAVTIGSGTTANAVTYICQAVDYSPLRAEIILSLSQRIANQNAMVALTDNCNPALQTQFLRFNWAGTTNTVVYAESQGPDSQSEGVGASLTQTATSNNAIYSIEWNSTSGSFAYHSVDTLDAAVLSQHYSETPDPSAVMYLWIGWVNGASAPASSSNIVVKKVYVKNMNTVAVKNEFESAPVKTYAMGVARQSLPATTPDNVPILPMMDSVGREISAGACPRDLVAQQQTTITNSASETTIMSAVSGQNVDLTSLDITNASAAAVTVTIKDATAGTTRAMYDIAANGGMVKLWTTPFMQAAAVNNNWTATLSNATTTVHITAQGCKMP